MEGDTCLRSADCSEGLCCARHFWSRICKPVLTEGQVCTRHRRKGTHGLELFQRCDCGNGMACRPEKGERDHSVSRTAARNLHTCQRRWHKMHEYTHTLTQDTHPANQQISHRHWQNSFQLCIHLRCWQTHTDTQHQRHSFLPKLLTQTAAGRIDMIPGKMIHPEGCNIVSRTDPIPHLLMGSRKFRKWHFRSLGKIDFCCR